MTFHTFLVIIGSLLAGLFFFFLLGQIISWVSGWGEEPKWGEPLYPEQARLDAQIQGANVVDIDGHTKRVDTKKRSLYIGKTPDGYTYYQRADKQRRPTGPKVYAPLDSEMAKYIREELNK
jgi:hypothetical protein